MSGDLHGHVTDPQADGAEPLPLKPHGVSHLSH